MQRMPYDSVMSRHPLHNLAAPHIPRITGKCLNISIPLIYLIYLPVAFWQPVYVPQEMLVLHHGRPFAWKVCGTRVVQFSSATETHDHSQFGRAACSQQPNAQFRHYLLYLICYLGLNETLTHRVCVVVC
jgi:hypothetical protein